MIKARLRSLIAAQDGFSLTELLITMVILGVIMAGLGGLFVSATTAEVDMNRRFQAQSGARLALDKLRRELHCAKDVTPQSGTVNSITITLDAAVCPTSIGQASVTWCVPSGESSLYRTPGTTCTATGGVKWVGDLKTTTPFTPNYPASSERATVTILLPVNAKSGTTDASPGTYRLQDDIVLRNSVRK